MQRRRTAAASAPRSIAEVALPGLAASVAAEAEAAGLEAPCDAHPLVRSRLCVDDDTGGDGASSLGEMRQRAEEQDVDVAAPHYGACYRQHSISLFLFLFQACFYSAISHEFVLTRAVYLHYPHIALGSDDGGPAIVPLFEYNIVQAAALFYLIAATHHFVGILPPVFRIYCRCIEAHANPFRASEYAFSSTLMMVLLAQVLGETNASTLFLTATANFTLQTMGYIAERYTSRTAHVLAWVPFIASWSPIFLLYYSNVHFTDVNPFYSAYIHVLVPGIFFLFCLFGLVQLSYMWGAREFIRVDWEFAILSLITKSFFGMLILLAAIQFPTQFDSGDHGHMFMCDD